MPHAKHSADHRSGKGRCPSFSRSIPIQPPSGARWTCVNRPFSRAFRFRHGLPDRWSGLWVAVVLVALLPAAAAGESAEWTLRLLLKGQTVEGTPLKFDEREVLLLGRDGQLHQFAPSQAQHFSKVSDYFTPYSSGEIRRLLLAELGNGYRVTGASRYMVAHPAGQRDLWAQRFDALYRSFIQYFTARGFTPQPPRFPLIAVCFANQREFMEYAADHGYRAGAGLLGFYAPADNRIYLFDTTRGQPTADWGMNAETIIHEATHQMAFNTGIHQRQAETPVWVAEGLATLFEAPGVWNASQHRDPLDRVNRYRHEAFTRHSERRPHSYLRTLVSSDSPFSNPDQAYAQAWGVTFYLTETRPRDYLRYLAKTMEVQPGGQYTAKERERDFVSVFGDDWTKLEAEIQRYLARLR